MVANHQQVLIEAIRAIVTITIIVNIVYHHDHHHYDHDDHDHDHRDLFLDIMIIFNVEQKAAAGIDLDFPEISRRQLLLSLASLPRLAPFF